MTKKEATQKAKALIKRMRDKGWKARVWENCGWHFCIYIKQGHFSLWDVGCGYDCMFSGNCLFAGDPGWWSRKTYRDPNRAFQATMAVACRRLEHLNKLISRRA